MKEIVVEDQNDLIEAQQEAILMSKVHHRYIVRYIESFVDKNKLYLIMDYCEKGDL